MLSYASHVGLSAKELTQMGGHLRDFPQDFSHMGLISPADTLDRALIRRFQITG
jgi:hypothetical protein